MDNLRYRASIRIGGECSSVEETMLTKAIYFVGASVDGYTGPIARADEVRRVIECGKEPLKLYLRRAPDGRFGELEQICRVVGLSYVVKTGGCGSSRVPVTTWWEPGMASPRSTRVDGDGDPVVSAYAVSRLLRANDQDGLRQLVSATSIPVLPAIRRRLAASCGADRV